MYAHQELETTEVVRDDRGNYGDDRRDENREQLRSQRSGALTITQQGSQDHSTIAWPALMISTPATRKGRRKEGTQPVGRTKTTASSTDPQYSPRINHQKPRTKGQACPHETGNYAAEHPASTSFVCSIHSVVFTCCGYILVLTKEPKDPRMVHDESRSFVGPSIVRLIPSLSSGEPRILFLHLKVSVNLDG